jgi:2-oxo-4-hydroxy-4-carboxy-5-ureidoimidazoline decarboxylase
MSRDRHTIAQLNDMSHEEFARVCGPVFEQSPWIAAATATQRPFAHMAALLRALCDGVRSAGPERQLELIRAHPDLSERVATLTAESRREQASAGLDALTREKVEFFRRQNEAYRSRFGFPFVICARLNKKEAMLASLEKRLRHSREEEIRAALEEIYQIAALRLSDIVE